MWAESHLDIGLEVRLQVYSVCCPRLPDAARDLSQVSHAPAAPVQTPEAVYFQYLLVLGRLILADAMEVKRALHFLIAAGLLTCSCLHFHKLPVDIFFFACLPLMCESFLRGLGHSPWYVTCAMTTFSLCYLLVLGEAKFSILT